MPTLLDSWGGLWGKYRVMHLRTAQIEITPKSDVPLTITDWTRESPRAPDRLWAGALLLTEGETSMAILTLDCLWISDDMRSAVTQAFEDQGIQASNVMLAASHTHSGPQTLPDPNIMRTPPDQGYLKELNESLTRLVRDVLSADPEEVNARYAAGRADGVVCRTRPGWSFSLEGGFKRVLRKLPDFSGPRDDEVRVLWFTRPDGAVAAVLFGYSCHPTVLDGPGPSRDYPGAAADRIAEATGAPAFFLLGFCGDLRPAIQVPWSRVLTDVRTLRDYLTHWERRFRYGTWDEMIHFGRNIGDEAVRVIREDSGLPVEGPLDTAFSVAELPLLGGGGTPMSLQRLSLGNHLSLVGLGAEVYQDFRTPLQARIGGAHVWPVGVANGVAAYLYPARIARLGPYGVGLELRRSAGVLATCHEEAVLEGMESISRNSGGR